MHRLSLSAQRSSSPWCSAERGAWSWPADGAVLRPFEPRAPTRTPPGSTAGSTSPGRRALRSVRPPRGRDVRRVAADPRPRRHDPDERRLRRHARPPRLDRVAKGPSSPRATRSARWGGAGARARRADGPPRDPASERPRGLRRSAGAPARAAGDPPAPQTRRRTCPDPAPAPTASLPAPPAAPTSPAAPAPVGAGPAVAIALRSREAPAHPPASAPPTVSAGLRPAPGRGADAERRPAGLDASPRRLPTPRRPRPETGASSSRTQPAGAGGVRPVGSRRSRPRAEAPSRGSRTGPPARGAPTAGGTLPVLGRSCDGRRLDRLGPASATAGAVPRGGRPMRRTPLGSGSRAEHANGRARPSAAASDAHTAVAIAAGRVRAPRACSVGEGR